MLRRGQAPTLSPITKISVIRVLRYLRCGEFTREEVKKCVATFKNRKAAGANKVASLLIYEVRGRRHAYHDGYVVKSDIEKRVRDQDVERTSSSKVIQERGRG